MIVVVDGRPELVNEVRAGDSEVRAYLAQSLGALLQNRAFVEILPGYLPGDEASQARVALIRDRLGQLAALS